MIDNQIQTLSVFGGNVMIDFHKIEGTETITGALADVRGQLRMSVIKMFTNAHIPDCIADARGFL